MAGEGSKGGFFGWINGGEVKVSGMTDLATGMPVHKLPSISPVWVEGVDKITLSNALSRHGIKHQFGSDSFSADTDYLGLMKAVMSILGLTLAAVIVVLFVI